MGTSYPSSALKVMDLYRSTKERIVHQIFSNCESENQRKNLPLFLIERAIEHPLGVSIYLLTKEREGIAHHFFAQCSTALLPGKITSLDRFFASNLRLEGFDHPLTLIEAYMVFQSQEEFITFNEQLDRFMLEIRRSCERSGLLERTFERRRLGISLELQALFPFLGRRLDFSKHQLERFLDRFWVEFQERIENSVSMDRWKRWFIRFVLLQKQVRDLEEDIGEEKEHKIQVFPLDEPKSTSLFGVALYLPLAPNEVFELRHLKKSLQLIHPSIVVDENSFVRFHQNSIFLVEMHTHLDRREVERGLKFTLTSSIERYVHQVFMPRNEEDVMRRIVTLCNEISTKEDIPQVAIHFERQHETYLSYLVLIVRPYDATSNDATPIERITMVRKQGFGVYLENTRRFYQRQVEVEASTIRLDIDLSGFLRADHSVDSLKVRAHITDFLRKIFPSFRDYNGGMISKQIDNLRLFKEQLKGHEDTVIENFFLSLQPLEIQYMATLEPLIEMFHFYLDGMKQLTGEHLIKQGRHGVLILASFKSAAAIDEAAKECVQTKFEWIKSPVLLWGRKFTIFYLYKANQHTMQQFEQKMNHIFLERIAAGMLT